MPSGTSAELLMFHTYCVASGKSVNLSELQVPLLRNSIKITLRAAQVLYGAGKRWQRWLL